MKKNINKKRKVKVKKNKKKSKNLKNNDTQTQKKINIKKHFKETINDIKNNIIIIINSKKDKDDVAKQFILEEIEAAHSGSDYIQDKVQEFFFTEQEYKGSMNKSFYDVDGAGGPQQYLLLSILDISKKTGMEIASIIRLYVVEELLKHYNMGRYFFNKKKSIAKTPLNLFQKIAEDNKIHPHFKYLMENENKTLRETILRWAEGFEDRDNKFNYEFQTTFNSSFWEIYLHQCFKDLEYNPDYSKPAPDFSLSTPIGNNNVEAVIANNPENYPKESEQKKLLNMEESLNLASARLYKSIQNKYEKYEKKYSKLEHVKDTPFIIAISPFEQMLSCINNNMAINRVLYGKDYRTGKEIDIDLFDLKGRKINPIFRSDKFKNISAIIFSSTANIGKVITQSKCDRIIRTTRYHRYKGGIMELVENNKYFETHLDGLQIFHNPYADKPLDISLFNKYEISHSFYDNEKNTVLNLQKDYTLVSRNCL